MSNEGTTQHRQLSWPAWTGLILGLAMVFHPLLTSGEARSPGGWRDPRLVHFQLEHAYGWLSGVRLHASLWNAPIFFPAENTTALSDTMVGFLPFYAPWRLAGLAPERAFSLWLATVLCLGFLAFFAFLRSLGAAPAGAAAGAFLFAFGSPVIANIGHPQLVPAVWVAVALLAVRRLLDPATRRRSAWVAALVAALTLQAWGAFYAFFFALLFFAIGAAIALVVPTFRRPVVVALRRDARRLVIGAAIGGLLLVPLARHYARAAEATGGRDWTEVSRFVPSWQSWTSMGSSSWLYGGLSRRLAEDEGGRRHSEGAQGMGFVTLAAAVAGLWLGRRRASVRLVAGVSAVVLLLVMPLPGGLVLWKFVHGNLPVADAVRAIGRILRWALVPAALGLAILVDTLIGRHQRARRPLAVAGAVILVGLVVLEQAHTIRTTRIAEHQQRIGRIATQITPEAAAFFVSSASCDRFWRGLDEDAMWAASVAGVPTINGRSGSMPPGWGLGFAYHAEAIADRRTIRRRLFDWVVASGVDRSRVVWLDIDCSGRVERLPLELPAAPGSGASGGVGAEESSRR